MGVPLLIKNGRILLTGVSKVIFIRRFFRTVIAQTKDRHIVLIVVESNLLGDFWWRSTRVWNEMFFPKGMSLMTLSQWLIAHGSSNALNLMGGSTGLALNSQVLVRPKLISMECLSLWSASYRIHCFMTFPPNRRDSVSLIAWLHPPSIAMGSRQPIVK